MPIRRILRSVCPAVAVTVAFLALSGCPSEIPETTSEWQDVVDRVAALRPSDFPEHLYTGERTRTADEFDVGRYFTVLTHVSMEPGYVLDWVYHIDTLGGEPVLYARRESDPPFRTEADLKQAGGSAIWAYASHVRTDDSAQGFFELLVLDIMGAQFYLDWHALYNDIRIVASRSALEDILTADGCHEPFSDGFKRNARNLDLEPKIDLRRDDVSVTLVLFTQWGGFLQDSTVYDRAFPHTVLDHSRHALVSYECAIMF
jgi:hypothetical protein